MLDITSLSHLTSLNAEQEIAFNKIIDPALKSVFLTGGPGRGKSYLTCALIKYFMFSNSDTHVYVLAPTHTAKSVLLEKLNDIQDKIHIQTVASFLGMIPTEANYHDPKFIFSGSGAIPKNSIVFADEVSMYSEIQVKKILYKVEQSESKIIWVGDLEQLPPVKAKKAMYLKTVDTATLVTPMRNAGVIAEIAEKARTETYFPELSSEANTVYETVGQMLTQFVNDVTTNLDRNTVWLARENKDVTRINTQVRRAVMGPVADTSAYIKGEKVRLYHSIRGVGHNNEVVTVVNVDPPSDGIYPVLLEGSQGSAIVDLMSPTRWHQMCGELDDLDTDTEAYKTLVLIPRVEPPYAMTIHKSQGMSIDTVYVDTSSSATRALLYVAYSRAKTHLHTVKRILTKNSHGHSGAAPAINVGEPGWVIHTSNKYSPIELTSGWTKKELLGLINGWVTEEADQVTMAAINCMMNVKHATRKVKGWTLSSQPN